MTEYSPRFDVCMCIRVHVDRNILYRLATSISLLIAAQERKKRIEIQALNQHDHCCYDCGFIMTIYIIHGYHYCVTIYHI